MHNLTAFNVIASMLRGYVMPPKFTAELYRALGDIPEVTIDRAAVDVAGQRGIGFAYRQPRDSGPRGLPVEFIISSRTFTYIGSYYGSYAPTRNAGGDAILRQALVSGPGVRP
jgi:hypothetical protein